MADEKERKEHLADLDDLLRADSGKENREDEADIIVEGPEPADFMRRDLGAADFMESVSEAEPYFPPTDPVVEPTREHFKEIEVVGGYEETSMDEMEEAYDPSIDGRGDEQITDDVERELREDAGTIDLNISVETERGIVHLRGRVSSLEDVELAEEVAGRIPGVEEVREELEIEGLE